jgi:hypothetical protein
VVKKRVKNSILEPRNTRNTRNTERKKGSAPFPCVRCFPWLKKRVKNSILEPRNTQNSGRKKGSASFPCVGCFPWLKNESRTDFEPSEGPCRNCVQSDLLRPTIDLLRPTATCYGLQRLVTAYSDLLRPTATCYGLELFDLMAGLGGIEPDGGFGASV